MPHLSRRQLFAGLIAIPAVGAIRRQTGSSDFYALRHRIDSGGFSHRFYGTTPYKPGRVEELKKRPLFASPNDTPIKATVRWTIEEPSGKLYFESRSA